MESDNLSQVFENRQIHTARTDHLTSEVLRQALTPGTYIVDDSDGHYLCATVAHGYVISWHIVDETGTEQESFLYRAGGEKWNLGPSLPDRDEATEESIALAPFDPDNPPALYAGVKTITKEEAQSGDLYICPAAKSVPCFRVPTGGRGKTDGGTTGAGTTSGGSSGGTTSGGSSGGTTDGGTP